jgi:hypothetical protein
MNERIKELWDKAAKAETDQSWEGQTKFMAKFAELIVRECVKVMYDNAIERKVPPDINQTPTHYAVAVLEHFGVEE